MFLIRNYCRTRRKTPKKSDKWRASEDFAAQLTDQLEVSEGRVRRLEGGPQKPKRKNKNRRPALGRRKNAAFRPAEFTKSGAGGREKNHFLSLKSRARRLWSWGKSRPSSPPSGKISPTTASSTAAYISLQEENSRLKSAENLPAPSGPPLSLIQIWQVVFAIWFRFWFVRFGN